MTASPDSAIEGRYFSKVDRVSDPALIATLLRRAQQSRAILAVTVAGQPRPFISAVLDINLNEGYLLLDELVPREGHDALVRVGELSVIAQFPGVHISFNTVVQSTLTADKGAIYRLAMPRIVQYGQRREHHRVRVGHAHLIRITMHDRTETTFRGNLHDISVGGVGTDVKTSGQFVAARGDVLTNCALELPSHESIVLDIEVRFIGHPDPKQGLRLGGMFVHLSAVERKAVERFVAALDRASRRKLAKDS